MNIDKMVSLCIKYGVTVEMFYVCMLIHFRNEGQYRLYREATSMFRERAEVLNSAQVTFLIQIKWIEKMANGKLKTTDTFGKFFITKNVQSTEFFMLYPSYVSGDEHSERKRYPLKNVNQAAFSDMYESAIGFSAEEHEEVMDDLRFAIANNYGFVKIDSFVQNKMWVDIRKERYSTPLGDIFSTVEEKNF